MSYEVIKLDISAWQKELAAGPSVWVVYNEDGLVCDLYESAEAADVCIAWHDRHGFAGYTKDECNIHTLKLAKERWHDTDEPL